MDEPRTIGDRLRDVRKRRGLTQRELAELSGLSVSLIRKLEQAERQDARLETLRKLALALRVSTSTLAAGPDAAQPEPHDIESWTPVRRALEGRSDTEPPEEPTTAGLSQVLDAAVAAVLGNRYAEVQVMLPGLLRDADTLVATCAGSAEPEARRIRSQVRQMTAYMMGQTWQFDAAKDAIGLAIDDASDDQTTMAAYDWKCWTLLRQGQLAESRKLAIQWADESEPRISRATSEQLRRGAGSSSSSPPPPYVTTAQGRRPTALNSHGSPQQRAAGTSFLAPTPGRYSGR